MLLIKIRVAMVIALKLLCSASSDCCNGTSSLSFSVPGSILDLISTRKKIVLTDGSKGVTDSATIWYWWMAGLI